MSTRRNTHGFGPGSISARIDFDRESGEVICSECGRGYQQSLDAVFTGIQGASKHQLAHMIRDIDRQILFGASNSDE